MPLHVHRAREIEEGEMDMEIRRIGLALCLMGAAYTASAGYVWSDFQPKAPPEAKPALATKGYVWSDFQPKTPPGEKAALATKGYSWSDFRPKAPSAEKPAAAVHGYVWSD
jgi:hypothetical protein